MRPSGWWTYSDELKAKGTGKTADAAAPSKPGGSRAVEQRLQHALLKGIVDFIDEDTEEARVQKYGRPLNDHSKDR
jgi:5-methyltetrahydrofolate--homocysteine methyltransferase